MQSGAFFHQHIAIVPLHALFLDSTLAIFLLFMGRKWVVEIVLQVRLKATLNVVSPGLSNVIDQRGAGAVA